MSKKGFEVALVADLPWPFGPFKCAFEERFEELAADIDDREEARRSERFGQFVSRLTNHELQRCPYHRVDWPAAAEAAIAIAESGLDWGQPGFGEMVEEHQADWQATSSFFTEPIWIRSDGVLGNGQHRVCALKCARAKRCLVEP